MRIQNSRLSLRMLSFWKGEDRHSEHSQEEIVILS
jgi:hypothetical protein